MINKNKTILKQILMFLDVPTSKINDYCSSYNNTIKYKLNQFYINQLINEQLHINPINIQSNNLINEVDYYCATLIIKLEDHFKIVICDSELVNLYTIEDLIHLINEKIKSNN